MRRAVLIPVLAALALAVSGTAGAGTTSAAKHLRTLRQADHGRMNDANELQLQVKITALTPATATTPGSLTLTVNAQPLVIQLPAGTVLPPSFVVNATVVLNIEVEQTTPISMPVVISSRHRDGGDDD